MEILRIGREGLLWIAAIVLAAGWLVTAIQTCGPPAPPCEVPFRSLDVNEFAVLEQISRYRMSIGLGPLSGDPALHRAAQWKANDMAARGYTSHDDTTGRDFPRRLAECGVVSLTIAEVIASGQETPTEVVDDWIASPLHDEILRSALYSEAGVGTAQSENGTNYWVVDVSN